MHALEKIDITKASAFTSISEIRSVLSQEFGIERIHSCSPLAGDSSCNLHVVDSRSQQYVLRIVLAYPKSHVETQIAYERCITQAGLPVPEYLTTSSGSPVSVLNSGKPLLVQKFADGKHPELTIENCSEMGRNLALLHKVNYQELPSKTHWMSANYHQQKLAELTELKDRAILEQLTERFNALSPLVHDPLLPKAIIHGDSHEENVLFKNGQLSAWLDWEEAGVDSAIIDIGLSALWFCFDQTKLDTKRFDALLTSYNNTRPLSDLETGRVIDALEYATLTACCWRFWNYGLTNPESNELEIAYERMAIDFDAIRRDYQS